VFIVAPFSTDNNNFDMDKFPKDKVALKELTKNGDICFVLFCFIFLYFVGCWLLFLLFLCVCVFFFFDWIVLMKDLSYFNSHAAFNFADW
jgi:hypothetical protein